MVFTHYSAGRSFTNGGVEIDHVIEIARRRRNCQPHRAVVCTTSGRFHHIEHNPPKVAGKDDETGEDLIQRDDDKRTVRHRLSVYHSQTKPLVAFTKI